MSGWSIDEIENIVWDRFPQSDDHMVPGSSNKETNQWVINGRNWKNFESITSVANQEGQRMTGTANILSEKNMGGISSSTCDGKPTALSLDDMWSVLDDEEFSRTTYNALCFKTDMEIDNEKEFSDKRFSKDVKMESENNELILGNCAEDVLIDVKGIDLDSSANFIEVEHRNYSSNNMLDYCLEDIADFEEVDKLFRNSESNMEHETENNTEELSWKGSEFSSVNSSDVQKSVLGSNKDTRTAVASSGLNDFNNKSATGINPHMMQTHDKEAMKTSGMSNPPNEPFIIPMHSSQEVTNEESGDFWSRQVELSIPKLGASRLTGEKTQTKALDRESSFKSADAHSYSQDTQSRQSHFQPSSLSALHGFPSSLNSSLDSQSKEEDIFVSSMQSKAPYLSASSSSSMKHMVIKPPLSNSPLPAQTFHSFGSSQMPFDSLNHQQLSKRPFDMLSSHHNMMMHDTTGKLRCNTKMQKMGVAESNLHNLSRDSSFAHKDIRSIPQGDEGIMSQEQPNGMPTSSIERNTLHDKFVSYESNIGDENGITEAAVLEKLQTSLSQLDIRTRLCIRDALYRLAKSAEQRHNMSGIDVDDLKREGEVSEGHPKACKRNGQLHPDSCVGNRNLETVTNVIDRTVAHLLFHRFATSSEGALSTEVLGPSTSFSPQPIWQPPGGYSSARFETRELAPSQQMPRQKHGPTSMPDYGSLQPGNFLQEHHSAQHDRYFHLAAGHEHVTPPNIIRSNDRELLFQKMKINQPADVDTETVYDGMMSETSSNAGFERYDAYENYDEDQLTYPISPPARTMLVH